MRGLGGTYLGTNVLSSWDQFLGRMVAIFGRSSAPAAATAYKQCAKAAAKPTLRSSNACDRRVSGVGCNTPARMIGG